MLGARMPAGIAYLRGYDVDSEEVRSAVLISLLSGGGTEMLKLAGVEVGKKTTAAAIQRIPGRILIEINKNLGNRLITKAGEKGVINLPASPARGCAGQCCLRRHRLPDDRGVRASAVRADRTFAC